MFRCVSEFISFITSEASDRCLQEKRKTINGEDILLAMLTLGFDSYVEPLRTFLTKVRDASKYDRTITMGGDLSDDIRIQVAQVNQPGGSIAQAQVATTVQIQSQPGASTSTALPTQTLASKTNATAANPNGLEPYGHSVRFIKDVFFRKFSVSSLFRFVLSLVFEMINQVKIQIMFIQFNRINKTQNQVIHRIQKTICILLFSLFIASVLCTFLDMFLSSLRICSFSFGLDHQCICFVSVSLYFVIRYNNKKKTLIKLDFNQIEKAKKFLAINERHFSCYRSIISLMDELSLIVQSLIDSEVDDMILDFVYEIHSSIKGFPQEQFQINKPNSNQ
jgi:hypothetical protein